MNNASYYLRNPVTILESWEWEAVDLLYSFMVIVILDLTLAREARVFAIRSYHFDPTSVCRRRP